MAVATFERLKRVAATQTKSGRPLAEDPSFAARLARVEIELENMKVTNLRVIAAVAAGGALGAESSMLKIRGTQVRQEMAHRFAAQWGPMHSSSSSRLLRESRTSRQSARQAAAATAQYLNSRKLSIYGGSNEIQRNIISKIDPRA